MAQWDFFANPIERARARLPYVIVVQSDLLSELPTRLVVPLARNRLGDTRLPPRLVPQFDIDGERCILQPQDLGNIDARSLRKALGSLRDESHRIVDAIDTVISGV